MKSIDKIVEYLDSIIQMDDDGTYYIMKVEYNEMEEHIRKLAEQAESDKTITLTVGGEKVDVKTVEIQFDDCDITEFTTDNYSEPIIIVKNETNKP
jgi:hypothetical protein